jgi:o-succinylbenzoate synthase
MTTGPKGLIAEARVVPYDLALAQPWRTAGGVAARCRGWLVRVTDRDGGQGFGDYVLPPTQPGPVGEARLLADAAARLPGLALDDALTRLGDLASPLWAVECALLDLDARRQGLCLARRLASGAADSVAVNGVAPLGDPSAALAAGFAIIKMKVGLGTVEEEVVQLHRQCLPAGVRLRLDANQAWTWDQACRFLDGIADLPIDGLEEPLADPTLETLAALQGRTAIDLAIDESLPRFGADAVVGAGAVRRLVMKAATVGGLVAGCRLAGQAVAAGMGVVVTSALDSAVGVAAAAHLAAAAGSTGLAHGLATSAWLAENVADPLAVAKGRMSLGQVNGLGVVPTTAFPQVDIARR